MADIFKEYKRKPINKAFWMKGTPYELKAEKQKEGIVEYEGIKVSYTDDIETYYCFQYTVVDEKISYKPIGNRIIDDLKFSISNPSFEEWVCSNFEEVVESYPDEGFVVIRRKKEEASAKSKEVLIKWANENMRMLEWGRHSKRLLKRLLKQSPREIGSAFTCEGCKKREKDRLYNLSTQVSKIKLEQDKIDYFVSHSWEDNYEQKWEALKEFSEKFFKKHKRYPTLWLDKVCINQSDSSKSLEVLPINIASSKKVLVLLSSSYIERLW